MIRIMMKGRERTGRSMTEMTEMIRKIAEMTEMIKRRIM